MPRTPAGGSRCVDPGEIERLFDRAADMTTAERAAFLERECAGRPELLVEVSSLLAWKGAELRPLVRAPEPGGDAVFAAGGAVGPYEILRALGRGGMGVVHHARHRDSGLEVALKTVLLADAALLPSLRREVRALAGLRHPGVIRILDEGVHEGVPWYAMELVRGTSLRQLLRPELDAAGAARSSDAATALGTGSAPGTRARAAPLPLREALRAARGICDALSYVHGEGIVHRDLKPDNVLVRPDGSHVIIDFGLAARFMKASFARESLELLGAGFGSPHYMAPEQIQGDLVDARADLYALGCILFELLTGRPPFLGETQADVLDRQLRGKPVPPTDLRPGLPAELDAIVLGLLAKGPRERIGYADVAGAMLDGLLREPPRERAQRTPYLYRPGMAGRDDAEGRLSALLGEASAGRGRVAVIVGESGVGKTRLALALAAEASRRRIRVIASGCQALAPAARGSSGAAPLSAFAPLFEAVLDQKRVRGSDQRAPEHVAGILGGFFAPLARGAKDDPRTVTREQVFGALGELLAVHAGGRALLLLVDDVQWADGLSVEALVSLAAAGTGHVLVVATCRAEEPGAAALVSASAGVETLHLARLERGALERMVADMLALPAPPAELVAILGEHTEGNPLFACEYLRAAVAQGLVARDRSGSWSVAEGLRDRAGLALPTTLKTLIDDRIAAARADARRALQAAAVLGRTFDHDLLHRVAGLAEGAAMAALTELLRRQLLEESDGFRFGHDKVREVAYEGMDASRRRRLHARAYRALRDRPDRAGRHAVLAHHAAAAGRRAAARRHYLAAAREAAAQHARQDALKLYSSYFALVDRPARANVEARLDMVDAVLGPLGMTEQQLAEQERALHDAEALREHVWGLGRTSSARSPCA
ncbi:MAG: protein kinase [Acidobacteriota bacterium]